MGRKCIGYLALSDTKLDDSYPKSHFKVKGYSLYRQQLIDKTSLALAVDLLYMSEMIGPAVHVLVMVSCLYF